MAIKYLNNVSLENNEIQNVKIQNLASDPVVSGQGQLIFNTSSTSLKYYDGTNWIALGSSSGTVTSVATGEGLTGGTISTSGTISLKNASAFTNNTILKWDNTGTQFVDSSIVDSGTNVTITGGLTVTGSITGNVSTATALATARDFSISGDMTAPTVSFDGTANVVLSSTLATVNTNVGSFGTASSVGTFTVNGKGLITAASSTTIAITASQITDFATAVDTEVATREFAANIGNGTLTSYVVTHNLSTRDVSVQCYNATTFETVYLSVERTTTNTITLATTVALATAAVRVVITKIG
jgi:hypothetical protein|tara:strand:- start:763 stop:1659 length:897 start_codon:yes stop_codon:yes gene_type:complete